MVRDAPRGPAAKGAHARAARGRVRQAEGGDRRGEAEADRDRREAVHRGAQGAGSRGEGRCRPGQAARGGPGRQEGAHCGEEAGGRGQARCGDTAARQGGGVRIRRLWPRSTPGTRAGWRRRRPSSTRRWPTSISSTRNGPACSRSIDDPAKELTAETLDASIDTAIEKSQGLRDERTAAAGQRRAAYEERLMAQADATRKAIEGYEALADEAAGPQRAELAKELEDSAGREGRPSSRTRRRTRTGWRSSRSSSPPGRRSLPRIAADPWIKRLEERIAAKKKDLAQVDASSAAMAQATEKTVAEAAAVAARDEKDFNALRDTAAEGAEEGQAQARA